MNNKQCTIKIVRYKQIIKSDFILESRTIFGAQIIHRIRTDIKTDLFPGRPKNLRIRNTALGIFRSRSRSRMRYNSFQIPKCRRRLAQEENATHLRT
jgi:hypothetical protein